MFRRVACTFALLAAVVLVAGCAKKFTYERFQMIKRGFSDRTDVERTLGKPSTRMDDMWFYEDKDEHYHARVHFDQSGKVTETEWIDARAADERPGGTWEGHDPNAAPPRSDAEIRSESTKTRRIDD